MFHYQVAIAQHLKPLRWRATYDRCHYYCYLLPNVVIKNFPLAEHKYLRRNIGPSSLILAVESAFEHFVEVKDGLHDHEQSNYEIKGWASMSGNHQKLFKATKPASKTSLRSSTALYLHDSRKLIYFTYLASRYQVCRTEPFAMSFIFSDTFALKQTRIWVECFFMARCCVFQKVPVLGTTMVRIKLFWVIRVLNFKLHG